MFVRGIAYHLFHVLSCFSVNRLSSEEIVLRRTKEIYNPLRSCLGGGITLLSSNSATTEAGRIDLDYYRSNNLTSAIVNLRSLVLEPLYQLGLFRRLAYLVLGVL